MKCSKALLITLEYPPQVGGVANYYYQLVNNLSKINVEVITNENKQLIGSWPVFPWLKSFFTIKNYLKKNSIDYIFVGQILPLGTVAWLIKKIYKKPYVVFTHAMDVTFPQKYKRKKYLLKIILAAADKVITVSKFTKYELCKLIKEVSQNKIEIISPAPNIVENDFLNLDIVDLKNKYHDKKIILSVGRIIERKGYDRVIQSLPSIISTIPNILYIIVGEGIYQNTLQKLVDQLKLSDYVMFAGKLTNIQVAQYYKLCDCFIMTSRELENHDVEGFGLVYLEANSFGKPVIAGKSGGIEDAVIDGKSGYLVDPNDVAMIKNAIIKVLTNQEITMKMGQFGKDRVNHDFQWKNKAKLLETILQ